MSVSNSTVVHRIEFLLLLRLQHCSWLELNLWVFYIAIENNSLNAFAELNSKRLRFAYFGHPEQIEYPCGSGCDFMRMAFTIFLLKNVLNDFTQVNITPKWHIFRYFWCYSKFQFYFWNDILQKYFHLKYMKCQLLLLNTMNIYVYFFLFLNLIHGFKCACKIYTNI